MTALTGRNHRGRKSNADSLGGWMSCVSRVALAVVALLLGTAAAHAANVTWLSTGTNMNSGTAVWSANPGSIDIGVFAVAGTGTNPYLSSDLTMGGLYFGSAASSGWTLSGASNATLTLNSVAASNANAAISSLATSGTNTVSANLALRPTGTAGTSYISTAAGSVLWLAGNVSGTTVQSFGVGTVVLSGSNSFSGRYIQTQSNATLVLNSGFALGGGGGIQLNPGAFSINNTSGASLTLAGNNNIYFGASGVGTGAQTLTFVGTNDLNLGSGTVVLANASKSISTTAGTLTIGSIDVSGVNSGTYGLTKNGAGTLAITGAAGAGYTGGLSLTTGILQVGNNTAIGTGTLSLANGTTLQAINGDVVLPNAWNFFATSGGAGFSGSQSLTLNGMGRYSANAGSAALTNNIDAGKVLTFQGGLDLYSGTAASAGTFTLQGTGNTTISGNLIQSTGSARSFTISNTGITTLSGSNTYMGTTTVSNGVLKLDSANALGGGNLTIGSSGLVGLGTGNSSFTRAAGLGTGQVQWNGGGFAAYGADATVDIGGVGASGTVNLVNNTIWSAATADSTVVFSNVANAANVAKTVTVNNGSAEVDARFTGPVVGGTASFTKAGAGTLEMTAASTYSGTVAITAGQLRFSGTGSLSGATGRVVVNGADAELKWNSSVALSRPITLTQGTLSGTGTIGTAVSVGSGAILSPGNSPGTQAFTSGLTWQVGGTYDWEINDASGTLGGNPGWDLLDVTSGTLNLASLTSSSQFNLDLITLNSLVSGSMANYTPGQPYTWQIVRTLAGRVVTPTGTATGGEDLTSLFNLVTTSWVSGPVPSSIQVKVSSGGTGLDLVIVPEPETVVLASIGAFMAGWSLWKRRRIAAICHPDSRA